jgi:lipopolysaccharide/colanic/teichoic acid biosynthesis glycosyltransferase
MLRVLMYIKIVKPVIDRIGAFVLIAILSPLFLIIVLMLALFQEGDILFVQDRMGLNGGGFKMLKFTSMVDVGDQKKITTLGRWLRMTSLDELPQLFNVLKGDMSLVGPRPLLMEYDGLYSDTQRKRHHVLPGITGWAQVNGRTAISWKEKFNLDIYYVDHCSFKLDCVILLKTITSAYQEGNSPEEKFNGTN